MFFSLKEVLRWLGLTVFEIFTLFVALVVFSVLVVLKTEGVIAVGWWWVYSPLFVADVLNAYFCVIVYIRMHIEVSLQCFFLSKV